MADELRAIAELLKDKIGLDPGSVGSQFLLRAASQRMRDLNVNDLTAYVVHLRQSPTELDELIEEAIVPESWFFRDERPFEWFRDEVRANWLTASNHPALRILSLPCAAGEEPYSIAIILSEAGLPARRYHIDAVDISTRHLAKARRGIFSQNAFRGSNTSYLKRYFKQQPEGYEIAPELRARVRFIQGSVLDSRLLKGVPPYDVIFCRNLLIYLTLSARAALLDRISEMLAPDGILVIGHADRLESTRAGSKYVPIGKPGCFAYRRITSNDLKVAASLPSLESSRALLSLGGPAEVRALEASKQHDVKAIGLEQPRPTSAENLISSKIETTFALGQASELANQGRFGEAIALCERFLREKGLSAPAYSLMGMICQAAGDHGRAEDCFRKAVYLDPGHDEALLALALLAEHRGDQNAAAGFRRRAERTATLSRNRMS
jgi:chemotaxis protein methyltransferase WspC